MRLQRASLNPCSESSTPPFSPLFYIQQGHFCSEKSRGRRQEDTGEENTAAVEHPAGSFVSREQNVASNFVWASCLRKARRVGLQFAIDRAKITSFDYI